MEKGEKVIIALVVVVTIGVIGGAAIAVPIMMEEMHKPEGCAKNCHEMAFYYDSLEESVHAGVDCHHCHQTERIEMFMYMGHALHHFEGMVEGMTFEELAEEIEEKPPASPRKELCVECHEEHYVVMQNRITSADISCVKCHDGTRAPAIRHTEHTVGEYGGYENPDYTGYECVACHNDHDIKATEETCTICHPTAKHP